MSRTARRIIISALVATGLALPTIGLVGAAQDLETGAEQRRTAHVQVERPAGR